MNQEGTLEIIKGPCVTDVTFAAHQSQQPRASLIKEIATTAVTIAVAVACFSSKIGVA